MSTQLERTLSTMEDAACPVCGSLLVVAMDAIGRTRMRCSDCRGKPSLASGYHHRDDAFVPQTLVRAAKAAPLPAIQPGQLRCQGCAVGVPAELRFCEACRVERLRASARAGYRRRRPDAPALVQCACGAARPRQRGRVPSTWTCERCR